MGHHSQRKLLLVGFITLVACITWVPFVGSPAIHSGASPFQTSSGTPDRFFPPWLLEGYNLGASNERIGGSFPLDHPPKKWA